MAVAVAVAVVVAMAGGSDSGSGSGIRVQGVLTSAASSPPHRYEPVAKFMTAVGSSPATYGLAFAAALLCRPAALCCAPFGSFGSLPLWVWPGLLGVNELVLDFVEKDGSKDALSLQGTVPNERKRGRHSS